MSATPSDTQTHLRHLRLLAIFHFVFAGLALMGVLFLLGHYLLMQSFLTNPAFAKPPQGPAPAELFTMFRWFYLGMGVLAVASAVGNLLSGLYLRRLQHSTFSLVVAGLNCLNIPLGTVLGIFTIMVLSREPVQRLYAGASS